MTNYVTYAEMDALVVGLKKDFAAIKKEMDERLRWRGAWKQGEVYVSNDLVQDKSLLHVCTGTEVTGRPGTAAGWRTLNGKAGAQ